MMYMDMKIIDTIGMKFVHKMTKKMQNEELMCRAREKLVYKICYKDLHRENDIQLEI